MISCLFSEDQGYHIYSRKYGVLLPIGRLIANRGSHCSANIAFTIVEAFFSSLAEEIEISSDRSIYGWKQQKLAI
jgi:hypothetical protein